MPWKWYEAPIKKVEKYTPTVNRFWLEVDEDFSFTPGQFITMDLPIADKRLKRWRSYSIANPVSELPLLECVIVNLSGGAGTNYLFNEVKIGDTIKFKGPDGAFVVPENPDHDMVMICTGTGVAPFRPMIHDLLMNQKTDRNIHLIFGCRKKEDLLYYEEWLQLEKDYENFQFTPCLSREENWDGVNGYVHQAYLEEYKDTKDDIKFYLCGWTEMIDEAVANLIVKMGYQNSQVKYELYG